jgi:archaellum biogenesis ATPase FlaH
MLTTYTFNINKKLGEFMKEYQERVLSKLNSIMLFANKLQEEIGELRNECVVLDSFDLRLLNNNYDNMEVFMRTLDQIINEQELQLKMAIAVDLNESFCPRCWVETKSDEACLSCVSEYQAVK